MDGTVRRTPVAEVQVDTPYLSGTTAATCMDNPLYDLIKGNLRGVTDPQLSSQVPQAVQPQVSSAPTPADPGVACWVLLLLPLLLLCYLLTWLSSQTEYWRLVSAWEDFFVNCAARFRVIEEL